MCLALSTVGVGDSGGLAADNQLTSQIALVRGANENKCEPLHELIHLMKVRQHEHGQVYVPDAGL